MPPQSPFLLRFPQVAQIPGAINLDRTTLDYNDLVTIYTAGSTLAQTTLGELLAFLFGPFPFPSRVVLSNAQAVVADNDTGLLINKTVAGPTPIALPTPYLSRMLFFKDMKGDANVNNITLDAGTGNLINGLQTLVMNGQWGVTMLVGMSSTQWGTII